MKTYILRGALLLCALASGTHAADFRSSDNKHLGVGSCGSPVCHGKAAADHTRDVALNEYSVWLRDDYHSRAYRALSDPQSKAIAAKLGLPNAAGAPLCQSCHADNVPTAQRGPKFNLTDGVSCEACHGGAEKWIKTHTEKTTPHKDNVANGLYPTEQPLPRAELCLSCHMGTRDRFATHVIMGAGHPRLHFELEVFTYNQPPHFVEGESYERRKGHIDKMNLWVTGQIENARRYLELLQTRLSVPDTMLPEFALYDCFSCHHPTDKLRWSASRAGPGIKPGTLRLQKYPFVMLQAMTEVLAPGELTRLVAQTDALIQAGQKDAVAVRAEAQKLHGWVDTHDDWTRRKYNRGEIAQIRKTVLRYAAEDKASDFGTAEQVVMCAESLSYASDDHEAHKGALNSLYDAVARPSTFDPAQFARLASELQRQF